MPPDGTLEVKEQPEGDLELHCKTCLSFDIPKGAGQGSKSDAEPRRRVEWKWVGH